MSNWMEYQPGDDITVAWDPADLTPGAAVGGNPKDRPLGVTFTDKRNPGHTIMVLQEIADAVGRDGASLEQVTNILQEYDCQVTGMWRVRPS